MYALEFAGTIIIPLIMGMCVVAGIGGGGVVVLLILVFFNFDTRKSIAISGFSILTCSVARFIYMINEKHPEKDAVAIDYGLATVMQPTVLIGSFLGVFVNVMLPPLIL